MTTQNISDKIINIEKLLSEQASKPFNLIEASQYLSISKSYLYKLTCANKIPFYKPNGKKIYFDKTDLDKWIFRNKNKSIEELNKEVTKILEK
ncbi:MAG TPA: excisionase family DNA-binding protein [Ignavibacteria bacterium]|nr:excisionase family DNA-binding protein [Ignavibacteria bacterium]